MPIEYIIALILFLFFITIVFVTVKTKKKKLSSSDIKKIKNRINALDSMRSEEQIMNLDKILDFALLKLGKKGSIADKLKESNLLFSDIDAVWRAHKLRNKIAHEMDFKLSEKEFSSAKKSFLRALGDIGVVFKS